MKKTLIALLLLVAIMMTACGSKTATTTTASDVTGETTTQDGFGSQPMSSQLELMVGTFQLEDTPNAVTTDQAPELLLLWQTYQSLSESDTAAQAEIDAVIQQIKDTMTPAQVTAIEAMQLTGQDMFTLMQEQGITSGFGTRGGITGTPQPGQFPEGFAGRAGDGPPEGFVPGSGGGAGPGAGGGLGMEGGQSLSPEQQTTIVAMRANNGGMESRIQGPLLNALIELLQTKVE